MAKLADLLESEEARSAVVRLAQREGEDVLTHHLRAAARREAAREAGRAAETPVATWESCI